MTSAAVASGAPAIETIATTPDAADRMTVDVRLNSGGPYRFLVDTGADRSVVSRRVRDQLGLPSAGLASLVSISGVDKVDTARIGRLSVGRRTIDGIRAPVLEEAHLGAAGVLGIDALAGQAVLMDFESNRLLVAPAPEIQREEADLDDEVIVVRAKRRHGQLILADAYIGRSRVRVVVDSGAAHSIGNSALQRLLGRGARPGGAAVLTSVTGAQVEADFAIIPEIRIGEAKVRGATVAFADVHPFVKLGLMRRPAMLLGMDLLRGFKRVSVDFASKTVRFALPETAQGQQGRQLVADVDRIDARSLKRHPKVAAVEVKPCKALSAMVESCSLD
jgi:predicted aspartyl protease